MQLPFHPIVRRWFFERFEKPTPAQEGGWPSIAIGQSTLIAAPTGSGKTLAAFLWSIDRLIQRAANGDLEDVTDVVYVSPLKALGNDIAKNLQAPLAEIFQLAWSEGMLLPEIRVAVRSGDTPAHERQAMVRKPPHILITTPESLYILLTAEKSRQFLKTARTVIVDEIHAVAADKRGAHLALSLERLDALAERPLQRIGLGATQKPIDEVARLLVGGERVTTDGKADCAIVDTGHKRHLELLVELPDQELGPIVRHEIWAEVFDKIVAQVRAHRTTLVFVNTRRLVERVAHQLSERLGEDKVGAHHGSLSRKTRLGVEEKLKSGALPVVVATASLELGIDIGHVDVVCQIGSARSLGVLLQRVGRSGHWLGATPKGIFYPLTRDDLMECVAAMRAVRAGELDRLTITEKPLDILAQQMVATVASAASSRDRNEAESGGISEEALFRLMRRAYPYRALSRSEFDQVLEMLSEGISSRRGRKSAHIHRDRVHGLLRPRRGARLTAITNGGAIPDTADYSVVEFPAETFVGTVNEDFAIESSAGDIFLLGNRSWRIRRVGSGKVWVDDAQGLPPTIPFWLGEAPGRTVELSRAVAQLREEVAALRHDSTGALQWLAAESGVAAAAAEQIVNYVKETCAVLGTVPTQERIVAERFFDEAGGMQLIIHSPWGARINRAWGMALRKRFCVSFDRELQAAATDDGICISLVERHSFPLSDVFLMLPEAAVDGALTQASLASPMFTNRWRWNATRALALLRQSGGKKVPVAIQRMRAEDLLAAVFPEQVMCQDNRSGPVEIPDHPLVNETMLNCLHEAMDSEGLKTILARIARGEIETICVDTPAPSPMAHEILNANPYAFLDDAPLEERRARAVSLRRVDPWLDREFGQLDAEAIAEVRRQAWPDVRNADELHDFLLGVGILPLARAAEWLPFAESLLRSGRATVADWPAEESGQNHRAYVAAERWSLARTLLPQATASPVLQLSLNLSAASLSEEEAWRRTMQGWLDVSGPTTAAELGKMLGLPMHKIDAALLALEAAGAIMRGNFTPLREPLGQAEKAPPVKAGLDEGILRSFSEGQYASEGSALRSAWRGATGASPWGSTGKIGEVEWCERGLLARIHRLTLGRMRKEIEPAAAAEFMNFLLAWQHVTPETRLRGRDGVLQVIEQLQGLELPAPAWEQHVLPARVRDYDPADLENLCLAGVVAWGRLRSEIPVIDDEGDGTQKKPRRHLRGPTRSAPIAFLLRDERELFFSGSLTPLEQLAVLTPMASDVARFLERHGASFLSDIAAGTGLLKVKAEEALWELVARGVATGDGVAGLRVLLTPELKRQGRRARLRVISGGQARLRMMPVGRWSLWRPGSRTEDLGQEKLCEHQARQLLRRYGIVMRELLARESAVPSWRALLQVYRRLEARGEIRGGRFVSGFVGEQFALPEAVEQLRAQRRRAQSSEPMVLAASDPLNLAGIISAGAKVSPYSNQVVAFEEGLVTEVGALGAVRSRLQRKSLAT
ncbi:MAG: DEAD/DEAH box helicase [Deltaproteobacteria bacterium]|nr:DEAD/DEAH box helicase [Deltaproteobacteria bacterium]